MITIRVYDRELNFVGIVPSRVSPSIQPQLGKFGEGVGKFELSVEAPELAKFPGLLTYGNIVVSHDSRTDYYFPWILEKKNRVSVAQGERAAERITVSGRGALALLADAIILSEAWSLDANPRTSRRTTSFASKVSDWYNPAEWVAPAGMQWTQENSARRRSPKGWPDPTAYWIWFGTVVDDETPPGYCYFRTTITLAGPNHVSLFASADNAYDMWVDGEHVLKGSSWKRFERYDADWEAGEHVVAIRGHNLEVDEGVANPAGILFSAWTSDKSTNKLLTRLRVSNTTQWLCRDGTVTTPGWDPGDVLKTFIDEGKDRGVNTAFAKIHCGWEPEEDSDGETWDDEHRRPRNFPLGQEVLQAAKQLAESSCDVEMTWDPEGDADHRLVLKVYKRKGTDRTIGANNPSGKPVVFQKALNTAEASYDGDGSGVKTALLIKTDLGWVEEVSSVYGAVRREAYVALGSSEDLSTTIALAASAFEKVGPPAETLQAKAIPVTNHVPFQDFFVGDDVFAPDAEGALSKTRVVAITLEESPDGVYSFSPEFSTLPINRIVRTTQWLRSMADGALLGRLLNASPVAPPETEVPTMAHLIDIPFSFSGPLTTGTSPEYTPREDALLVEIFVTLTDPGSTPTEVGYLKNGVLVDSIELAAGSGTASLDVNEVFSGNADNLQISILVAGSGAADLTVQARFN